MKLTFGKVMFSQAYISHSIHTGLCIMPLPICLPGPMFILTAAAWSHVPSGRGSLSGNPLWGGCCCKAVSIWGFTVKGVCEAGLCEKGFQ